jgi:hypothetical protein
MVFLIVLIVLVAAATGCATFFVASVMLLCVALDAFANALLRGSWLFLRLATWCVVRFAKLTLWAYSHAKRVGLWGAQHAYVWLFVVSFRLRQWYVASELRRRA